MTITTPLSLCWERTQQIDLSAIEPLGLGGADQKKSAPLAVQPGSAGQRHWSAPPTRVR
jgi:hypothetical protein